jgi:hypothetical protein
MRTHLDTQLSVGYGEADLQAPLGASMPGYFNDRKADGVLDPLKAKAVVLRRGGVRGALVALDLIGLNAPQVARCRAAVADRTGLKPEDVWVHTTHTHTGTMVPRFFTSDAESIVPGVYVGEVDDEWAARTLPDRVAGAVAAAVEAARPGPVELAETTAPGLAFYRRFRMKDGAIRTNPGKNNPDVVGPNGDADPTLTVLRFPAARALVVIFGLHPDTVGGTKYSADYPHHLTERIREGVGRDWGVLFLNAACGDINHIDVTSPDPQKGDAEARRIGRALGEATLGALAKPMPVEVDAVGFARRVVPSRLRVVPEEVVKEAERILREEPDQAKSFNGLYAPAALVLGRTRDRELPAEVTALRLGPVGLVGMPGEYFVELARIVQHDSPLDPTRVLGLTNGSLGYIPHEKGYEEGGYEAGYRSARFRPGTGEAWARAAVELLGSLT